MLVRQNGFHVLSQRGSQVNALFLVQALGQKATNVSFVPQNDSNDSIQDLPHGLAFIRISSRHGDFSDDAAAGDRDVSFEAIELQLFSFAVASGSQPFEESSTRGSIDVGNDHGKAIHDMNGFFQSTHEPDDGSMHLLVEYPKVGTLADEARTISQVGKKCRPVTREVFVNGLIILVSQEFANDHHRDDFTVGKIGIGPPGAELVVLSEFGDKSRENIVNEGVDKDEEFIYGEHGRTSWFGFGYLQGGAPVSFVTPLAVLGAQVGPNLHGSYLNPPTQQTLTLGSKKKFVDSHIAIRFDLKTRETSYMLLNPKEGEVATEANPGQLIVDENPSNLSTKSSAIVFGSDSRLIVNNPWLSSSYRNIVKIFSTYPTGQTSICTGTMVGARVIATSAHCLYKYKRGGYVVGVRVVPALEYDYMPFGDADAQAVVLNPNWASSDEDNDDDGGDADYDFGLITIDRALGDLVGWVGTTTSSDPLLAYSLHGYPEDLPAPFPDPRSSLFMYGTSDVPRDYDSDIIYHETDTAGGQSGAGLIRWINGIPYSTSTHRGTCWHIWTLSYKNCAVRYTSARVNMVAQENAGANNYPIWGTTNGTPWTGWNGWTQIPPTIVPYGLGNWTQVFVVGGDQQVYTKTHTAPTNPGGWHLRSGATTSTPVTAIQQSGGNVDAFVRGLDGSVRYLPNAVLGSSVWQNLGGVVVDTPAVVEMSPARLDIFGVGPSRKIFQNVINNSSGNTTWNDLGGGASSNVVAISKSPGTMDLFVLGFDGGIWTKSWNGSSWTPSPTTWTPINSGFFSGQISAVSWGNNRIDLFALGQSSIDSSPVWHVWWSPSTGWSAPNNLQGVVVGGVIAVSKGPNQIDLFARSPSGDIWQKTWNGGPTWLPSNAGWNPLGGDMMEPPAATTVNGTIDIVARGKEGQLWNRWWNGSQWQ